MGIAGRPFSVGRAPIHTAPCGSNSAGMVNVSGASIPGATDVTLCLISNVAKAADARKMVARAIFMVHNTIKDFQFRQEFCETPQSDARPVPISGNSRAQGCAGAPAAHPGAVPLLRRTRLPRRMVVRPPGGARLPLGRVLLRA